MIALQLTAIALAVVLVSGLGGCGGQADSVSDGPLSSGNGIHGPVPRGSICVPGGQAQTFGDQQFTNYGHRAVVLDRVVLLRPQNERLIGSYAVPGRLIVGTVPWPPTGSGLPSTWKNRRPVHGFRVSPGKSFNMVLGIEAVTPNRATSQGMLVYYHDSAGSYEAKNYYANIIAKNTHTC
ncbi:MAG TPA: hypothetical protein VMA95_18420 [Streptosporangiaceae bacterium]|nr:hypothetical protein [Streptosporangiaceae bacterium]